ncbi:MAG: hypothetical protein GY771_09420, partial [bacterium]|nr:hypothetical protein [bacterium]
MIRLSAVILPALLLLSPFAYGVDIGFGGSYQYGVPLGGMTGTISAAEGTDSGSAEITDG